MAEYHQARLNSANTMLPLEAREMADFFTHLECSRRDGPRPRAFTFRQAFTPG